MTSTGPSIRAVCRILNKNSCGSGSICGLDPEGEGAYVLSNAHVCSTEIGRKVVVEVESLNSKRFTGRVIRAAYSDRVSADWALLHVPGLLDIEPVHLTRELPAKGESLYTKGFPKCRPHNGTDITQRFVLNNGVLLWEPNAIGGQSGSGVWGDNDGLQKALLTWSMTQNRRWYGGGQLTAEIWKQNRDFKLTGTFRAPPRMPDWEYKELTEEEMDLSFDRDGLDDPEVSVGIFSEPVKQSIQDYPIWDHMFGNPEPVDPNDPSPADPSKAIKSLNRVKDTLEEEIEAWRNQEADVLDPKDDGLTFGL